MRELRRVRRGRRGPPDPLRVTSERGIAVVHAIDTLAYSEHRYAYALVERIEALDRYEYLAKRKKRHDLTPQSEVPKPTMYHLVLDKAPYLTVNHSVELSNKNDLIPELTVLTEKLESFGAVLRLPFATVKYQLALVNDQ